VSDAMLGADLVEEHFAGDGAEPAGEKTLPLSVNSSSGLP
jgi:hypothetical protein